MSQPHPIGLKLALGEIMSSDNIMHEMHQLCDVIGKRPAGSPGEERAKQYLLDRFRVFGLSNVQSEPFPAPHWKRGFTHGRIVSPVERPISLLALPLNGSHSLRAKVVWASFESEEEFRRIQPRLEGAICINRGEPKVGMSGTTLHRSDRIRLAHEAGAAAFLWVSNWRGHILPTGSMDPEVAKEMPAFGITLEDALLVKRLCESNRGDVELEITTANELETGTSWNISAELTGTSPDVPVVLLTAHYDSHDITEGAFDNAAGCAVVLECARAFALHYPQTGCRLRFVIFSAEEVGLRGSTHYANRHQQELSSIRFLLNVDGIGAVPSTKYIHVPFRDDVVEYLAQMFQASGYRVDVEKALALNWDHAPFALRGVPVGSMTAKWPAGTLLHYGHTPSDTLDKIDSQDMRYAACCAALLVLTIALDTNWSIDHWPTQHVHEELERHGKAHVLKRFT